MCKNITENHNACKLKGAEEITLHKPDVCEAKHAYNNSEDARFFHEFNVTINHS